MNASLWVQKQTTTSCLTVTFFELSRSRLFLHYQLNENFTLYASKHFSANVFILWELITKLLFILCLREKWSDILFLAFKNKCRGFFLLKNKSTLQFLFNFPTTDRVLLEKNDLGRQLFTIFNGIEILFSLSWLCVLVLLSQSKRDFTEEDALGSLGLGCNTWCLYLAQQC